MSIITGLFFCVVILLNDCFTSSCSLPKLEDDINWDMLPDRWYETLNTGNLIDSIVPCYVLDNIHSDRKGGAYGEIKALKNITRDSETYAPITQHWQLRQDKTYIVEAKYMSPATERQYLINDKCNFISSIEHIGIDVMKSLSKERNAAILKNVIEETSKINQLTFTFLTDYEHYFMGMQCIDNVKNVWAYGRNAHATDVVMKYVLGALHQVGGGWEKVALYPAGCSSFKFLDDFAQ